MKYLFSLIALAAALTIVSCKKKKENTTPKVTSQCYFEIDTSYAEPVGGCQLTMTHETSSLSVMMSRNNDLLMMSLSDQIAAGTYSITDSEDILFMMYQPDVTADPYVAVSTNLTINSHDLATHTISGTVEMVLVDDASHTDTLVVTNGSFSGSY